MNKNKSTGLHVEPGKVRRLFCYPSPSGTDELSQFSTDWLGGRQTEVDILPYLKYQSQIYAK
jgi:hypothetical protein